MRARSGRGTIALSILSAMSCAAVGDDPARLVVHEWGVNCIRMSGDLQRGVPGFLEDIPSYWILPRPQPTTVPLPDPCPAKPIVYFYPEGEIGPVSFRVRFARGAVAAVWPLPSRINDAPYALLPARSDTGRPVVGYAGDPVRLDWNDLLLTDGPGPDTRPIPADRPWIEAARDVDAAWVRRAGMADTEPFLFYDGVGSRESPLRFSGTDDALEVRNAGERPVEDLIVCRSRDGMTRIEQVGTLPPGEIRTIRLELLDGHPPEAERAAAREHLERRLRERGLFPKEASGMARVWERDFFATDGIHAIHAWTREEYDADLPTEISPPPAEFVRVGLVWIGGIRPRWRQEAATAIGDLGGDDWAGREAAMEALRGIGPGVVPLLEAAAAGADPETAARAAALLREFQAAGAGAE